MRSPLLAFLASLLRLAALLLVVGMVAGMMLAFFGHPVILHWLLVLGPFTIAVIGILAIPVLWGLSDNDAVFISLCNQCASEVEDAEVQDVTVEKC